MSSMYTATCGLATNAPSPIECIGPQPSVCALFEYQPGFSVFNCIASASIKPPLMSGGVSSAAFLIDCIAYDDWKHNCDAQCLSFKQRVTCSDPSTPYCAAYQIEGSGYGPFCATATPLTYDINTGLLDGVTYGADFETLSQIGAYSVPSYAQPAVNPSIVTTTTVLPAAATTTTTTSTILMSTTPSCTLVSAAALSSPLMTSTASPSSSSQSSELSSGAVAGIAVGATLGGLLVIALIVLLIWRSHKKRGAAPEASLEPVGGDTSHNEKARLEKSTPLKAPYLDSEPTSPVAIREMRTDRNPRELDAERKSRHLGIAELDDKAKSGLK